MVEAAGVEPAYRPIKSAGYIHLGNEWGTRGNRKQGDTDEGGEMNTHDMNKKQIEVVWWPDTESETGRNLKANDETLLEMRATHHGDHDEFWIVQYKKIDGEFIEVARHNPRYIESFSWA